MIIVGLAGVVLVGDTGAQPIAAATRRSVSALNAVWPP